MREDKGIARIARRLGVSRQELVEVIYVVGYWIVVLMLICAAYFIPWFLV